MKKLLWIFGVLFLLTSCGNDDDICLGQESTPRLKLKFRNESNNLLMTLDTLYVDVDYGKPELTTIISAAPNVDSVFVPLRIDDSPYTDFFIRQRKTGPTSKIRISYDKKAIYVSPACGFKINYENLNAELLQQNPVQSIQSNNSSLTDESKTNFYLRF
ncbi:DUF6452 family protein [Chryseobacterium sp. SC28]|uniref:DUF6452 family protein n=1 Tax=Chryseobacterium sp. SC28 TaxID=2268028 RepID=UPI000F650AF5|nr:DUF6452 family protein [Chryseobacterium sp. SC28]RRQ46293.1 hypothetical protein DTW91_06290 [Chryseobacterium sp. SC28]